MPDAILLAILVPGSARNPHVLKYAPVSPRWPCPDWLRQLRMMRQTFYFSKRAYKKSLHWEAFRRCFPFLFSRASLLESGAKVKKEAENSSIHACVTLCGKNRRTFIEKGYGSIVNLLTEQQIKEREPGSLFSLAYARAAFAFSTRAVNATLSNTAMSARILRSISTEAFFRPLMNLL